MIQKIPDLGMHVEVMGCPTTCQHCWAVGRPYQAMPLEEISWIVHEVRRFCDAHDLTVDGYPMHEVAAHPQASQIMRLFHDLWNVVEEPLPTTGVPLSTRDDWRELLEKHHALVRRELQRFRGREIDTAGDGFLATFDGPARAVRCAAAIRDAIAGLGLAVRAGLHTGECELVGSSVAGIAVHLGARIAALAGAGPSGRGQAQIRVKALCQRMISPENRCTFFRIMR